MIYWVMCSIVTQMTSSFLEYIYVCSTALSLSEYFFFKQHQDIEWILVFNVQIYQILQTVQYSQNIWYILLHAYAYMPMSFITCQWSKLYGRCFKLNIAIDKSLQLRTVCWKDYSTSRGGIIKLFFLLLVKKTETPPLPLFWPP